jgi:cycloeucalenol cycloisomerase
VQGKWLSEHPGKRATERFWLLYTPFWGLAAGIVMMSGAVAQWTDLQLLPFALVLAAGAVAGPILVRPASERGIAIHRTAGAKLTASVVGFALLLNYSQTPFFFDVLHMRYGFATALNVRGNPIALYLLTIPYFATYCVLCLIAYRLARRALARYPRPVQLAGVALAPFAVAFLETALNANPFTRQVFCYDDLRLMLWFGTFSYGTAFCLALPVWLYVDERPGVRVPLVAVLVAVAAAVYVDTLLLDLYRYQLAPLVTTVVDGAPGLGVPGDGCLSR